MPKIKPAIVSLVNYIKRVMQGKEEDKIVWSKDGKQWAYQSELDRMKKYDEDGKEKYGEEKWLEMRNAAARRMFYGR